MPLPLVGASIWNGLDTLQDFKKLRLGNIVLTFLPETLEESLLFFAMTHEKEALFQCFRKKGKNNISQTQFLEIL